jgi:hypothetical protein
MRKYNSFDQRSSEGERSITLAENVLRLKILRLTDVCGFGI